MTSTYFSLLAEFETAQIPLEDVCKKYFNVGFGMAKRRAANQDLPVPVFRLIKGKIAQYFVFKSLN